MKIARLKTMLAFGLALAVSGNVGANQSSCNVSSHSHNSSDSICVIPIPHTTIDDLSQMFAANFHSINRVLNVIFAAEAFALHPIPVTINGSTSPPTINVVEPHIAELIEAANGEGAGSLGQSFINLSNIFQAFGINSEPIISALRDMTLTAEQYSIAVTNDIPSTPYLDVWLNAGNAFADALTSALELKPNSKKANAIYNTINSIIINQANGVQAFNEDLALSALLPCKTQSAAALKFDNLVRLYTIKLYRIIALEITKVANKNNDCQFSQFYNLYDRKVSVLQQITRDLDITFVAEAFAPHPIPVTINHNTSPPTINVENPHVAELVNAVNGDCIGSIPYSLAELARIFRKFGVRLKTSNITVGFAAEQYSIAVANQFSSTSYLIAWLNASMTLADQLARSFDLKPTSKIFLTMQSDFISLVINEAQSVQAFNGVLPSSELLPGETQSAAALRFLQQARIAIIDLNFIISELLIENKRKKS